MGDRLEDLRARKAAREAAREAETKAREEANEAVCLTLEEEFEAKGLKLHVDFEVVTNDCGNFVVARPEYVVGKQIVDAEKMSIEDMTKFVLTCIRFPDAATARSILMTQWGLIGGFAEIAMRLAGVEVGKRRGKP